MGNTEKRIFIKELAISEAFAKEINMDKEFAIHSLKGIFKRMLYPELAERMNAEKEKYSNNAELWKKVDLAAIAFTIRQLKEEKQCRS